MLSHMKSKGAPLQKGKKKPSLWQAALRALEQEGIPEKIPEPLPHPYIGILLPVLFPV